MAYTGAPRSADSALLGLGQPSFGSPQPTFLEAGQASLAGFTPTAHAALDGEHGSSAAGSSSLSLGGAPYALGPGLGTGAFLTRPSSRASAAAVPAPVPVCTFFMRTGTCAYGDRCKFQHPRDRPPPTLNGRGYPIRPEEPDCAHYLKKGWCAFNLTCKFNHPELPPPSGVGSPFAQYMSLTPGGATTFNPPAGTLYSLGPSAVPVVYYVPGAPAGLTSIGGIYPGAPLPGAYAVPGANTRATAAGQAYHQQQASQQAVVAAAAAQQQLQQHAATFGVLQQAAPQQLKPQPQGHQQAEAVQAHQQQGEQQQDALLRADQLSSAMQNMRLRARDPPPPQQQQQAQARPAQ